MIVSSDSLSSYQRPSQDVFTSVHRSASPNLCVFMLPNKWDPLTIHRPRPFWGLWSTFRDTSHHFLFELDWPRAHGYAFLKWPPRSTGERGVTVVLLIKDFSMGYNFSLHHDVQTSYKPIGGGVLVAVKLHIPVVFCLLKLLSLGINCYSRFTFELHSVHYFLC